MSVLVSSGCEWLWCLAAILGCWWCLSLALQDVSGCGVLLQFWPTDDACPWLSREWVAMVPCCTSSLLMMPVFGSPVGEWLWCLAAILSCWWHLFLVLQLVSGCGTFLQFCWWCLSLALQKVSGCSGLFYFSPVNDVLTSLLILLTLGLLACMFVLFFGLLIWSSLFL